ncbi:TPA: methyltransferase domain-containing protein [Legionella pneumophila]|nr:class I SAM-dependent methyltransferase [Legionella pneumophila]HAT1987768.1 class I SAM-dependent methyltransferase [Legionella pneumophila]HAT1989213.1 class I SAM-dependent methyltransferase [Legionella pneumophila]HAT7910070.1 methyltransferase domain-containing protein [Legionella pneumophila]HAT7913567.1 methyltransferase domain-containing protein [Legionella pneumophila]HAT7916570.1 methyltransferase domain-containing protein [Legionella pneumophila]
MDSYLDLGACYYDSIRVEPPEEAYAFYRSYVSESSGLILEPMCGSGRFLLPLVKEGLTVHGFDASPYMLASLHHKAQQQGLAPCVSQGLIETFKSHEQYSLIFIPSGSFGHIIDTNALQQALENMHHLLEPGGLFIFEVETSYMLPKELGVIITDEKKTNQDELIRVERCFGREGDIAFSKDKYELYRNGQLIRTEHEQLHIRLYDQLDGLISLLENTGFKQIKTIKGFDRSMPPEEAAKSIIFECMK